MEQILRKKVKIQTGGVISFVSSELLQGTEVEVIVIIPIDKENHSLMDLNINEKPLFQYGALKGKIRISDDFDAPLEDFKEYMP